MHRPDVRRIGRIVLQLLAELQHVGIHGPRCGKVLISPHLVQKLLARDYPLGVLSQKPQDTELLRGGRKLVSATRELHPREIDNYISKTKYSSSSSGGRLQRRHAPA